MRENLDNLRHSAAHVLAAAVLDLWPSTKQAIGPSIEDGFYYDFDFRNSISENDLEQIETKMAKILTSWNSFEQKEVSVDEAKEQFKDNPYKIELIDELAEKGEKITLVTSGAYTDLCRGGHTKDPQKLKHFKLLSIAGAYWRGDEKNKMLTRIYGTVFPGKKELDEHLKRVELAKERDHRKLGKELDLFCFSPLVGAGLPLFTPSGTLIRNLIDDYVWDLRKKEGYERVDIPHLAKKELYEKSGHWDKFGDELFHIKSREDHHFVLKPMNCPHHIEIFRRRKYSYRDMPIRYASTSKVYRDEQTGELVGLTRVRSITQDDAHVFAKADQVENEIEKIWDIVINFYTKVGFSDIEATLSLHDPKEFDKYLGDKDVWKQSENVLRKVAQKKQKKIEEIIGEAAFYGPKIDFMAKDSLGRSWQVATIQLDTNMPERFSLVYTAESGTEERVVLIHSVITGAIERFFAVYLEHTNGKFPLWLSPVQIAILPITEKQVPYAKKVADRLHNADLRVRVLDNNETLGRKIRQVKIEKVPYFIVVGEKEMKEDAIKVENREGNFSEHMKIENFLDKIKGEQK